MDYDNDGILDFISGSYDPGDLYLFRGEGNGNYARVEKILDKSGMPLVHHPEEYAKYQQMKDDPAADEQESIMARVASFGSWVAPVDWEADGDLDLLIGSFAGDLFLRINEGSREQPIYDTKSTPIEADGKPLHVNMHAAPVVEDWNADGLWDLIVGSGDGAVGWFENIGSHTEPTFGRYQQLITPASDSKFFEQHLGTNDAPTHGARAQICVTDYNHDGQLDLILGDYSQVNWKRDLNETEQAEFDELMEIQAKMTAWAGTLREEYYADQENAQLMKKLEQLQAEYEKLERRKGGFFTSSGSASFIWLFLRNDPTLSKNVAQSTQIEDRSIVQASRSKQKQVSMKIALLPVEGLENELTLSVDLTIHPGWHLYSDVPAGTALKTTTVDVELPEGIEAAGKWERPIGLPSLNDPSKKIYSRLATFTRNLKITKPAQDQSIQIIVDYQACNEKFCLPPAVLRETVAVQR